MKKRRVDLVQTRNPKTNRYVVFDRVTGRLVRTQKSRGPYKRFPIARKARCTIQLAEWLPLRPASARATAAAALSPTRP